VPDGGMEQEEKDAGKRRDGETEIRGQKSEKTRH